VKGCPEASRRCGARCWRQQEQYHAAQRAGRDRIFRDYRIRVAAVLRDYGLYELGQVPQQMPPKSKPE